MGTINITRAHGLGLEKAKKIAREWQFVGEKEYGLNCDCTVTDDADIINFKRSGVSGTLKVTEDAFEMKAKLGFLLSAFQERIETEIHQNLDKLIADNA